MKRNKYLNQVLTTSNQCKCIIAMFSYNYRTKYCMSYVFDPKVSIHASLLKGLMKNWVICPHRYVMTSVFLFLKYPYLQEKKGRNIGSQQTYTCNCNNSKVGIPQTRQTQKHSQSKDTYLLSTKMQCNFWNSFWQLIRTST